MLISVQILIVVRGPIGGTVAGSNNGLEGILSLLIGTDDQLDLRAFRQAYGLLGLKRAIGVNSFDGDGHG
jgi:hypothetical protein